VLTNYNNINKDSYFNNLIIIKADLKIRLFRLIKINYSEISIDLYYQISQIHLFCNNLFFVFFRTIIIRFSSDILNICNNSKLAHTIVKQTRTKTLIKKIISSKKITIRKIKNTIQRKTLQKNKTIKSKSSFFKFRSFALEIQNTNNAILYSSSEISFISIFAIAKSNRQRNLLLLRKSITKKLLSR